MPAPTLVVHAAEPLQHSPSQRTPTQPPPSPSQTIRRPAPRSFLSSIIPRSRPHFGPASFRRKRAVTLLTHEEGCLGVLVVRVLKVRGEVQGSQLGVAIRFGAERTYQRLGGSQSGSTLQDGITASTLADSRAAVEVKLEVAVDAPSLRERIEIVLTDPLKEDYLGELSLTISQCWCDDEYWMGNSEPLGYWDCDNLVKPSSSSFQQMHVN